MKRAIDALRRAEAHMRKARAQLRLVTGKARELIDRKTGMEVRLYEKDMGADADMVKSWRVLLEE